MCGCVLVLALHSKTDRQIVLFLNVRNADDVARSFPACLCVCCRARAGIVSVCGRARE